MGGLSPKMKRNLLRGLGWREATSHDLFEAIGKLQSLDDPSLTEAAMALAQLIHEKRNALPNDKSCGKVPNYEVPTFTRSSPHPTTEG